MKSWKSKVLMLLCAVLILVASSDIALAAGTVSQSLVNIWVDGKIQRKILTLSWTADSSDASVPATTINAVTQGIDGWYLYMMITNPGAVAPTDNYDITITNTDAADIAWGQLLNRDASTTEAAFAAASPYGYPVIAGNLTFTLSNNAVNSAVGTCILIFTSN